MKRLLLSTLLAVTPSLAAQAADLNIALQTMFDKFDPSSWGNNGAPLLYNVYDTLIERDPFSSPVVYKPGLATEWTRIDPLTWELKLRDGVKMHDGTTMDAEDVAYSLNRIFRHEEPQFISPWGTFFYNLDRVEVVDPLTVRIVSIKPEPLFEAIISLRTAGIVSKEYYDEHGFEYATRFPIGSGPYRVTEFTPGDRAVLERFDDFWGEKAPLDRVTFQLVEEVASRVTGLANGEFDLITHIPPDQQAALDSAGLNSFGVTWPMFHVWIVSQTRPPTDNAKVRQAMRLCTDSQALVDGLWGGLAHVPKAHQFEEYGAPFYMPELDLQKHDIAKAKRLLAEADYKGEPIVAQFTQSYYLYGDLAAQVIQQQWQECGLNLQLEQIEQYDYDKLHIRAWSNPMYYPDPMGAMDVHWSPNSSFTRSGPMWQPTHPDWAPTFETARFGETVDARKDAYRKLLDLDQEEAGWILLYEPHEIFGFREGVEVRIPVAYRPYVLPLRAGQVTVSE
ncbi:MAG: ABC transporter substrate-binding protein [Gemmobacter sp.]|nr:ABC transporter substrate-binding protein [Gemmobacter sp.]